jgi:hypothetical protein
MHPTHFWIIENEGKNEGDMALWSCKGPKLEMKKLHSNIVSKVFKF